MAFFIPRQPLTPGHRLALDIDPTAGVVRAQDLAAWVEAEQAVAAARGQAQAIMDAAQAAFEAERQRGYQQGTELARTEASQHMAEQVARTDAYFTQIEDRLVALVMQGIRKIILGYTDHERVVQSVRSALAAVRNQKQMTLRVHPANVQHVESRTAELLAGYPGVALLDVVGDMRLPADGCVLESDIGVVEASTEGQLAALEAAFRKARGAAA
ncbi:MAG: HrpE/YscL family type III secretion apparatus protein [Ramlibacter sp.]